MVVKTDNTAEIGVHVFERAGLGKAPFRFVGFYEKTYQACPGAPIQPGSTCDYCGQGIMICCEILSADGKRFKVGSDCVNKTGDRGLIRGYKQHPAVRERNRQARMRADQRKIAEWNALWADPATEKALEGLTREKYWGGPDEPYAESIKRVWDMCGASGRARYLKELKTTLKWVAEREATCAD